MSDFTALSPAASLARRPQRPRADEVLAALLQRGLEVGRDVLLGELPGVVVGYNIGAWTRFAGAGEPVVVRTARGVTRCHPQELTLA